jgi:uncharacterized protein YkwD
MNLNWVDLIILIILVFYATMAWRDGFIFILCDFASFLLSLIVSLRFYKFTADFLKTNFHLSQSISGALGFITTSILLEILIGMVLKEIVSHLPQKILKGKFNKLLGVFPAVGEGILLTAFLMTSVIALPVNPAIKKDINESRSGKIVLKETSTLEKYMNSVFGGSVDKALTYFTVEPQSNETFQIPTTENKLSIDYESEHKMLVDLNNERKKRGLSVLTEDSKYQEIARDYASDLWTRHYFSHYTPEGKSVADRFNEAGINYLVVGENLALSPTEETAHTGLMNSEGHRENILSAEYSKVGIGVIDNGIYGKMFVQEFTN